ncbi:hypothetical protein [Gordonia amicalis]|uniref:hypothetical protein n=1 Tax=Gordonia amicalis TaxID=89053 RepID=UPI003A80AE93
MTDTTPDLAAGPLSVQSDYVSTEQISQARHAVSAWVMDAAVVKARRVGFAWVPTPDAPSTYPELCAAFARSIRSGGSLPVSSEHSGAVIWTSPEVNYAMRFVHDVSHVERKLTFSLCDEFNLALWHLSELERAGFAPDSLEYAFLKADALGQVIMNAVARRFPADQELFALECQQFGFEQGILREIRRESS